MAETLTFSELIDCRIKFTTSDGMFEGDVKTVSNSFEKMILQNCVFLHDNIPVGTLFLLFKEVSDVEVINQPRLKNISSLRKRSMLYFNGGAKSSEITTEDFNIPPSFGHLPSRIFTISSIGEEFKRAIDDLRMSPVIGISLEGLKIGRFGLVNWLCASSRTGTYLFDLQLLGRKVFDFGLRKILESSVTEKVIHDCRQVSDALYRLYDTKLSRVFDTQTAEAFVNLQINSGDFHGYVNSLDICLQRHLDISEDYLPQPAENIYPLKVKSSLIRPPGHHEMSIMIKNVIYLRSLRDELKKKMLNPFRGGVETYLKAVASKSGMELRLKPHDPIRIPGELIVEDKFRAIEYKETPHIPIDEVFNLPYTGQYSIVNKLNEIRKQNPHSNAEDIRAKLPKVSTRRGPYHYLEPVCILDVESRSHSGKTTSDELKPRSRSSNSVGVFVPEKKMVLSGEKSMASKTGTSKHSTSSVSLVKKELPSGSKLPLNNHSALEIKDSQSGSSIKNNKVLLGEKVSSTEAETSKQTKVRIGKVLAYLRQNGVLIDSCSPSETKSSQVNNPDERVPSKDKENHCFQASSVPRCEKEWKTNQDSSDTSQYEMSDYNTVQYNRDGTFCFLPRKNVSSTSDPSDPWAALKSNYYPEHDSVGNHHALKHKFVPAGAE